MRSILFGCFVCELCGTDLRGHDRPANRFPWSRISLLNQVRDSQPDPDLRILLDRYRSEGPSADLCEQIGIAYTQLQDFPQAEKFYREAVRLNPQFWAARKNLATVLWFMNRHEESEREFLAVAKARPSDPVPHLYLGLAAYTRHEFPHAKAEFEKAGALALENPEVLPAMLESSLASHDASVPRKIAEQLANTEHPDAALAARIGALFLQYGYPERAAMVLEKVTGEPDAPEEVWQMLAEAYDRQNKPEEAYRAYTRAVELKPDSEETYIAFADFASAHGNDDYALHVVGKGLERLPQSAGLLCERGLLFALKGERAQAESSFLEAGRLKPEWALPLLALGIMKLEAGDYTSAAAIFQKARTVEPRDFRTHYLYAMALAKGDPKPAEAMAALRTAIELNPADARPHTLLGQLLLAANRPDEAASEWERALKIAPDNATALYQLGLLYKKQGKTEQANRLLAAFQRVKKKTRDDEQSLVEILKIAPGKQAP